MKDARLKDSHKLVRSFKRLRDLLDVKERKVCGRCPQLETCPFRFKLPNSKHDSGVQDVFNVLMAYGDTAVDVEASRERLNVDDLQVADAKDVEGLQRWQMYGIKYRSAIVVLNSLESVTREYA